MPRFLNTWTGEFEWREDPRRVAYAILSHTWSVVLPEQSYADVLRIQATVKEEKRDRHRNAYATVERELDNLRITKPSQIARAGNRRVPQVSKDLVAHSTILSHPDLSHKIKGACEIARKAGYRLIWIDSCCIDKSSSAELLEAINSMYELYRLADVCYVYLEDVYDGTAPDAQGSLFRLSRWHTRGWTLQELIAPDVVVFLTHSWHLVGTKIGLASTLEDITGIDFDILTGRTTVDRVSIARRMSWAARRETTRVEDRAYSLMGLFGVQMSPIYGEGTNAFLRLQEEIIKTIPDQSIFAWGNACTLVSLGHGSFSFASGTSNPSLLAESPEDFAHSGDITPLSPAEFSRRLQRKAGDIPPPVHCVFTPQGVRLSLLCISFTNIPQVLNVLSAAVKHNQCYDRLRPGDPQSIALLQCEDRHGALIALPLFRPRPGSGDHLGLMIATHTRCGNPNHPAIRTIRLASKALEAALPHVSTAPVIEVSLLRRFLEPPTAKGRHPGFSRGSGVDLWPGCVGSTAHAATIHVAPGCAAHLRAVGFELSPLQVERSEWEIHITGSLAYRPQGVEVSGGPEGLQIIQFQIALLLRQPFGDRETAVHFSVSNSIPLLPQTRTPRQPWGPDARQGERSSPPPDDAWPAPPPRIVQDVPAAENMRTSRPSYFKSGWTTQRTLGEAQFIVAADSDWTEDAFNLRVVRLRLERSLDSHFAEDKANLWISIDVSEKHRHTQMVDWRGRLPRADSDASDSELDSSETTSEGSRDNEPISKPYDGAATSANAGASLGEPSDVPTVSSSARGADRAEEFSDRALAPPNSQLGSPHAAQIVRKRRASLPTYLRAALRHTATHGSLELCKDTAPETVASPRQMSSTPSRVAFNDAKPDAVARHVGIGHDAPLRTGPARSRATLADTNWNTESEDESVRDNMPADQAFPTLSESHSPTTSAPPTPLPKELDDASRTSADSLHGENDMLRARTEALASQVSALAIQNAALSSQNNHLSEQVNAMSAQIASILSRLEANTA